MVIGFDFVRRWIGAAAQLLRDLGAETSVSRAAYREILEALRSAELEVRNAIVHAANLLLASGAIAAPQARAAPAAARGAPPTDYPYTDERRERCAPLRLTPPGPPRAERTNPLSRAPLAARRTKPDLSRLQHRLNRVRDYIDAPAPVLARRVRAMARAIARLRTTQKFLDWLGLTLDDIEALRNRPRPPPPASPPTHDSS